MAIGAETLLPPRPDLSEDALEAWRGLFRTYRLAIREAERRLAEAGLPPIGWYDVLYSLYRAPERRLNQHTLAEQIGISPSGLSRLLDRMAERDLLERRACEGDRRTLWVELREAGIELMRVQWRIYGAVVAEHFAPAIADHEPEIAAALAASARSFD